MFYVSGLASESLPVRVMVRLSPEAESELASGGMSTAMSRFMASLVSSKASSPWLVLPWHTL